MHMVVKNKPGFRLYRVDLPFCVLTIRLAVTRAHYGTMGIDVQRKRADAIENHTALVEFDTLRPMWVMAENDAGASIDRRVCNDRLIVARARRKMYAPVHRYKDNIGI